MLRNRKLALQNPRAASTRPVTRAYRPRSEDLESRALLTLFPGNPITAVTHQEFSGFGKTGTTSAGAALTSFEQALGGANNNASASAQTGGFRTIDWDAVKLDGTDFGGGANTTVINLNKTIAIPRNRFQSRGVLFDQRYAVSGDGFTDVNTNVAGLFQAFSPNNTFAPPNDNSLDLSFTLASAATSTPTPAATRGFGAIFLNTETTTPANPSTIEYFDGDQSLGVFNVPTSIQGDPEFLGEVFANAVVTRVKLTLGTDTVFSYNGNTFTGNNKNDPTAGTNLVVTDDFAYGEPVPFSSVPPVLSGPQGTTNAQTTVSAIAGTQFAGKVATFSDSVAAPIATNYTATINWGDNHISNGTIAGNNQGGFDVFGLNTYATSARFPISVTVQKFDAAGNEVSLTNTALVDQTTTTTTLTAVPVASVVGQSVTLTATVAATPGFTPTGTVTFNDGTTSLGVVKLDSNGTATLSTSKLSPGVHSITAVYNGDGSFKASTSAAATETVRADVTGQVNIVLGKIRKKGNKFTQHVDLTNLGSTLPGPLAFLLGSLPSNVKLLNASGAAQNQSLGGPFITLSLGSTNQFAQNGTNSFDLSFSAKKAGAIRYVPRIIAGPGPL